MNSNGKTEDRANTFLRMIRRTRRGRLKIYLGYVAGVGKTYQMLQEGRRLKSEGIDVVAGFVETHGRKDTERLIEGLEVVARKRVEYKGHVLEEMDLDAILERKPEVVLIDELAHTNVPGSRNPKRYQDVQDVLAAGVHVITTLNIQHLESLYDTVEKHVHVKVRERLPDSIIAEADEIVNVDLTAEDLQERLREGKIYPLERAQTALGAFFKISNLEKLRELTLRELASHIDLRMRETSSEEAGDVTPDQVMVCLSSAGPNSNMLLRYGSRLAGRLNRNWYAVYVQTPSEEPTVIDSRIQRALGSALTLAKQLNAIVFTYKGYDVADTIIRFAKEYRVGHIVVGYPGEVPYWKRLLGKQNIVEQLIRKSTGMTIVVLDTRLQAESAELAQPEIPEDQPIFVKPVQGVAPGVLTLSSLISSRRIIIFEQPVEKDLILKTLVEVADRDVEACDRDEILELVRRREDQGSTFFNQGVALPHARIEGITTAVVSMAVTHEGVLDDSESKPISVVFLILSPAHLPEMQVHVLALVSRAARNRQFVQSLSSAARPEEVLAAIRNWEAGDQRPAGGA
jgi:two-component system, OmpR family, sensor histidine kinase KdpD